MSKHKCHSDDRREEESLEKLKIIKEKMRNYLQYWIYIMTNKNRSVLYIGVTDDLKRRYLEHKTGALEGFTKRYNCHSMIYYEEFKFIEEAIQREKELKGWSRSKKMELIHSKNPELRDYAVDFGWDV